MKLSKIHVDVQAQEEGQWLDHPRFPGVQVKVRSIHSEAYRRKVFALQNAYPVRRLKRGELAKNAEHVQRYSMPTLCLGWKGIEDAEYSEEVAKSWVEDDVLWKKSRLFWDGIVELAQDVGEDEAEAHEEALGN